MLYNFSHIFRSWGTLFHQFSPARLSTWKTFPQRRPLSFFSLLLNAEFLTPAPSFPSPPIASSIPFSIQCPPVAIVNRFTAASNRKPAVDQLSASSEPRFSRSGIDGPSTLCRNFSSRHRLLHYKSPLRKIDAARGSPLFQRLFPTLFRFFFFPHSLEPCELILAWKELVFVNYKSSKNDYFSNSNLRKLIDATFWNNVIVRYIENIKI